MVFAGCSIVTGRCLGVVIATGINTVVGNIFNAVEGIKEEKSPLTRIGDSFYFIFYYYYFSKRGWCRFFFM